MRAGEPPYLVGDAAEPRSGKPTTRDERLPPLVQDQCGGMTIAVRMRVEPKDVVSRKYEAAWEEYRRDPRTWSRDLYAPGMQGVVEDPSSPATMQFVDFEAWCRRYGFKAL